LIELTRHPSFPHYRPRPGAGSDVADNAGRGLPTARQPADS